MQPNYDEALQALSEVSNGLTKTFNSLLGDDSLHSVRMKISSAVTSVSEARLLIVEKREQVMR